MTSPMSEGTAPATELAVVVVVFAGGEVVARTLDALQPQLHDGRVRVVVAYGEGSVQRATLGARYPWAHWVTAPSGTHPARLRALGVGQVLESRVVVCTEDHCTPAPDWCAQILSAHQGSSPAVIGGAIEKATPASATSWAAYLLDYSRYLPPFDGTETHASDCNVSYPTSALTRARKAWAHEFHETVVHDALRQSGVGLTLDPAIVVRQDRTVSLGAYLGERVEHGRLYASKRASDAPLAARVRWSVQSVLLPLVLTARVMGRVRARTQTVRVPGAAWPALALTTVAWSWGEFLGYATRRER